MKKYKYILLVLVAVLFLLMFDVNILLGDGANTYESKTHGFKFKRPLATWTFNEKTDATAGSLTVSLVSPDSKSSVHVLAYSKGISFTPLEHREEKFTTLMKDPKYSNLKREAGMIAGQKASGLSLDAKGGDGSMLTLCQYYLAKDGFFYILQCTARKQDFKNVATVFKKVLETFEFVEVSGVKKPISDKLADRCGSEVQWFTEWDAAAKKAQQENKLVLVIAQFYGGFSFGSIDFAKTGPFMEPDIVELAKERFVILQLGKNTDAPFRSDRIYGMGSFSFGKAILFATPDGRIVGDAFDFQPDYLYEYAVKTLKKYPEFAGTPVPEKGKKLDKAEMFLRRGELEKASDILEKASTAQGYRLKASLCRRFRQGNKALEALKKARSLGGGGMDADLSVDEAVIHMRMGKMEKAEEILSKIIRKHSRSECLPEAMYWLGLCRLAKGEKDSDNCWQELVQSHSESRWAWKAAANINAANIKGMSIKPFIWPDEKVMDAIKEREWVGRSVEDLKIARQEAASYLVEKQRPEGSWISSFEVWGVSDTVSPLRDGKTALCALGLLGCRGDSKATKAASKALDFLLKSHEMRKKVGANEYYMDYVPWSDTCMLMFFAECLSEKIGDKRRLAEVMNELVRDLQSRQRSSGGWSYYISASLGQGQSADTRSISFVTAATTIALVQAKKSGIAVPDQMLRSAIGCLEKMRGANGSFSYFSGQSGGTGDLSGGAGRAALCELALFKVSRSDKDNLTQALDIFLRYHRELAGQKGKALMHTGRHGQGSHYLLFDYAFTAATVKELPENKRDKYRQIILELVLDSRTEDGSYLDSPLLGYAYGTGMALLAFEYLK